MRTRIFASVILITLASVCFGQQQANQDKWNRLMGEWIGEGGGQPGQGGGTFSFTFDLDKNIIVRKSHSEFPASGNRPATIHDDLMIIYPGISGNPAKAIYFDNEGHIINYSISYDQGSIILTSEKVENSPVFRLTYTFPDDGMVNTKFEMSRDGVSFMTYIEGKSRPIK